MTKPDASLFAGFCSICHLPTVIAGPGKVCNCFSFAQKPAKSETPVERPVSKEFVKHDKEKEIFSLIDPEHEEGLAKVLTHGAKKYADENWKLCKTPWRTYYSALRRHLAAIARGDFLDPDSGLPHVDHISCNVMFLGWFARHGGFEAGAPTGGDREIDDVPSEKEAGSGMDHELAARFDRSRSTPF